MTKAQLEERLGAFRQQQRQALANLNAIEGAIQALEQIVSEWEKEPDVKQGRRISRIAESQPRAVAGDSRAGGRSEPDQTATTA
jgi:sensor domain CHASE-containing protein